MYVSRSVVTLFNVEDLNVGDIVAVAVALSPDRLALRRVALYEPDSRTYVVAQRLKVSVICRDRCGDLATLVSSGHWIG